MHFVQLDWGEHEGHEQQGRRSGLVDQHRHQRHFYHSHLHLCQASLRRGGATVQPNVSEQESLIETYDEEIARVVILCVDVLEVFSSKLASDRSCLCVPETECLEIRSITSPSVRQGENQRLT
eukprot:760043-Hanusia_phi.AAC.3